MNAKQLREKFGISKKENLRDCFSEEELKSIQSMVGHLSVEVGIMISTQTG